MHNIKDKNDSTIGTIHGNTIKNHDGRIVGWIKQNIIEDQENHTLGWINREKDAIGGNALLNLLRK